MSSSVITSSLDNRYLLDRTPVWKKKLTFSFVSGNTAEEKITVPINGLWQKIIAKCSSADAVGLTATVAVDDSEGNEVFKVDSLAESTTYSYNINESLAGEIVIGVLPSANPESNYTVTVYLRGV